MAGEAKHLFKAAWEELVSTNVTASKSTSTSVFEAAWEDLVSNRESEKQKTSSKLRGKTSTSASASVSTISSDDHDSDLQSKAKRTKLSASHALLKLFTDFRARRAGILKALTTEAERFDRLCDPEKENLCLYGLPNETWDVNMPDKEAPPDMPEPVLGINFARVGMKKKEWLAFVAVHSDAWLIAVTFYFGARLGIDQESRMELFSMINDLPTIFEVVTGAAQEPTNEMTPKNSSEINKSASQPVVVKEEIPTPIKSGAAQKGSSVVAKGGPSSVASTSPVTEDEIRKVLLSSATITPEELVGQFRSRIRNPDDKEAFRDVLKRISKVKKNPSGTLYVVLK